MPQRVRINRGERRTPFLSNLVKGTQDQLTPNGCAYSGPWPDTEPRTSKIGAETWPLAPPQTWKNGNRSGE